MGNFELAGRKAHRQECRCYSNRFGAQLEAGGSWTRRYEGYPEGSFDGGKSWISSAIGVASPG